MDSYDGLPTELQLRELEAAWSEARSAVSVLNQAIAALPSTSNALKPVVLQP